MKRGPKPTPTVSRFWAKVERSEHCWNWLASLNDMGYGKIWSSEERRLVYAHRFAYELLIGPIPLGLDLDHLCRNPSCVRPSHLEPVTRQENLARGVGRYHHALGMRGGLR